MIKIQKENFEDFFKTPFAVYPESFPFVSELKMDLKRFLSTENPLFKKGDNFTYFTAYKNEKLAGRITAHIHNESNEKFNTQRGYFGYFDLIDDLDVAKALLDEAENFCRSKGCNEIIGNFNFTAMQKAGVVTKFYKLDQYTDQIINPLYTPELLVQCGYDKTFPMKTFEIDLSEIKFEAGKTEKVAKIQQNSDYTFDDLTKSTLNDIIEPMRECINEGMNQNPLFVPLTYEEIYFQAKDLTLVMDKSISVICRHNNIPIGVIICIPDLNPLLKKMKSRLGLLTPFYFLQHKLTKDRVTMIIYSVKRDFHAQGVNSAMIAKFLTHFVKNGYKKIGGTWIADTNLASLKIVENFGAKPMHELHLFSKKI